MRTAARNGFSLVETMIVLAIVGLMVGIVAPSLLGALPGMRASGAARQVLSDFRYARTYAVDKGFPVVVEFTAPPTAQYQLFQDRNANQVYNSGTDVLLKQETLTTSYTGITLKSNLSGTPSDGVDLDGSGGNVVGFNTNGTASGSGAVYLMPATDAGTSRNDRNRRVRVVQATGTVVIESPSGSNWQ